MSKYTGSGNIHTSSIIKNPLTKNNINILMEEIFLDLVEKISNEDKISINEAMKRVSVINSKQDLNVKLWDLLGDEHRDEFISRIRMK
jgi:hypothetical protein